MTDTEVAEAQAPAEKAQPQAVNADNKAVGAEGSAETEVADGEQLKAEPTTEEKIKEMERQQRRDNRKIGKLTALRYQMQKELEEFRKQTPQERANTKQAGDEPKESDFETYGQYLKAVARYEAKNEFKESQKQSSEDLSKSQAREWEEERGALLEENTRKAKEAFPDFVEVMKEYDEELKAAAPHVYHAFLEADNGAFAGYLMAKEGMIDGLNAMSPQKVGMLIARMEDKALTLSKTKTVTKAPTPMAPAKGSATGSKDPSQMSDLEFARWRRASLAKKG